MTNPAVPTLLRLLLKRRNCDTWPSFQIHFPQAAKRAATELGNPKLATVRPTDNTFRRWLTGDQEPRGDARIVLEHWLGFSVEALLQPAPLRQVIPARQPHAGSVAAAHSATSSWMTSGLTPTELTPGAGGHWRLAGNRVFDGTAVTTQLYDATANGTVVVLDQDDHPHLRQLASSSSRSLLLASTAGDDDAGLFVLDTALARSYLAGNRPGQRLSVPKAHRLDDLTYGLLWAMINTDDSLLADDRVLEEESESVKQYLTLSRSAPSRASMPDLSAVGAAWLGSSFCAQHIVRSLQSATEVPLFWTREQYGEEASAWLLFRHKHDYLRTISGKFGGIAPDLGRAFCVPETAVRDSERYERILFFLSVALMEMYGLRVWLCTEPEYAEVDGFVLVPGERAILANWLRGEAMWHVDTIDRRVDVLEYGHVVTHARTHSIMTGKTPGQRLHTLADYLQLDWAWLTGRCRELGDGGAASMLRPRSRLLTLTEVDRTLRYVADLACEVTGRQ